MRRHRGGTKCGGGQAGVVILVTATAIVDVGYGAVVVAGHPLGVHELSGRRFDDVRDGGFVTAREEPTRNQPRSHQGCERLATQLQS